MGMTPEGKVKKAIKAYFKEIGAWYYMPMSNGMGRVGCPDFIVCYRGLFFAFETKAPGKINNVTPNQEREIFEIIQAAGVAVVVDDVKQVRDTIDAKIIANRITHQGSVQQETFGPEEASRPE
jgi:hypothetical protein